MKNIVILLAGLLIVLGSCQKNEEHWAPVKIKEISDSRWFIYKLEIFSSAVLFPSGNDTSMYPEFGWGYRQFLDLRSGMNNLETLYMLEMGVYSFQSQISSNGKELTLEFNSKDTIFFSPGNSEIPIVSLNGTYQLYANVLELGDREKYYALRKSEIVPGMSSKKNTTFYLRRAMR